MLLCSINDLKLFLEKNDSDHDSLLELLIEMISSAFEKYTGRLFTKTSRTEYFNAGGSIFQLKAFPIDTTATFTVTVDDQGQTVNDDYYIFDDLGYIEFVNKTTKTEPRKISILYTGGYATKTEDKGDSLNVPDDLKFACILQSVYWFRNRKLIGQTSMSLPDGSVTLLNQDEFLPSVITVLDRYKI